MFDEEVKVNSHGVNAKIKAHILPDDEMKAIGFTNYHEPNWFFCRRIKYPKTKTGRYNYFDVTFNVTIPKDGSDIRIDILDEDFGQPYDYQHILNKNPKFEPALITLQQVEEWMEYLQSKGVLSGHV